MTHPVWTWLSGEVVLALILLGAAVAMWCALRWAETLDGARWSKHKGFAFCPYCHAAIWECVCWTRRDARLAKRAREARKTTSGRDE